MCLNDVLGSVKAKIANAAHVIKNTTVTKIIFILRIKGFIYFFKSSLNLNKFFVKNIWANISKEINKIIISFLILENNLESISKPKKDACNAKNIHEKTPK